MNFAHTANDPLPPLLVGYDAAARMLGIGRRQLEELVYTGDMPSVPVGRRRLFRPADLQAWVDARVTTTPGPSSDLQ